MAKCSALFSCQRRTSFWHAQKQGRGVAGMWSSVTNVYYQMFCFFFLVSCERLKETNVPFGGWSVRRSIYRNAVSFVGSPLHLGLGD